MLRFLNASVVICLIAAAVVVYEVKYQSTYEAQKVARIVNKIRVERERIAALRAEWSELSAPARVQWLASRYLRMRPLGISRIDDFSALPEMMKPMGDPIGDIIEALPGHAGGRRDPIGNIIESLDTAKGETPEKTGALGDRD